MAKNSGRVLTLKEASKISGVAVPTLRMRLKKGLIEGVKRPSKYGEVWHIKADSIKEIKNVERVRLNNEGPNNFTPLLPPKNFTPSDEEESPVAKAQRRHIDTLDKQTKTYEKLLTDFQARINILESDKLHMEYQIKLLPAPPEMVSDRLGEMERTISEQKETLTKSQRAIKELQAALEAERKRPWWKKIMGLK